MSMFLFLETSIDKSQLCQMEVRYVTESILQNLHHKAEFDGVGPGT